MKYTINVIGCDDATTVEMQLNDIEIALMIKFAKEVNKTSSYVCMPVIEIKDEQKKIIVSYED